MLNYIEYVIDKDKWIIKNKALVPVKNKVLLQWIEACLKSFYSNGTP